ncbi:insulinase family protein [Thalassomonas haliotis]|uniref:Protease 3 n=1 Tax=Thalassomonas haliotis TaxID=485448 RepID=A0ABY7VIT7_9GAMM|nr:insulinase family protein [Thalassomonas haliotis]WDE13438.1 insulinase family protein [Thalassomonas haliotis]
MTLVTPILARLLVLFLTNVSFCLTAKANGILKSPNDSRTYDTFTLNNGMEVVLASDPTLAQSAASLTVGIGQYQDPDTQQGLAHYLEHVIFMGSQSFPKSNALQELVKNNDGFINATTEAQQTNYFFRIDNNQFDPALAIFSDALKSPLFEEEFTVKELNAIENEWQLASQGTSFAIYRANALTASPNHPMRKMGLGNLSTLQDKENSNLQAELTAFYQIYYSANIMKLALVGKQSLPELKALASKYFSKIPNKGLKRPVTTEPAFTEKHLGKHISLLTRATSRTLGLQFPLKNNIGNWPNKPNSYLHYLLASEAENTLVPTLRKAGLIESMQASFTPAKYGIDGSAYVSFVLTDKGKTQENKIIAAFFNYLELIKSSGISQEYAQTLKNILTNQFANLPELDALNLATLFSRNMSALPTTEILRYSHYFTGLDKNAVQEVLSQLSPDKVRVWHIGDVKQTDIPLMYAQSSYGIRDITKNEYQTWQSTNFSLMLPKVVKTINTTKIDSVPQTLKHPQKIIEKPGIQAQLMHSQFFNNNQGITGVVLQSPLYQQNVKHHVMTNLLFFVLNKDLQRLIQEASLQHQVYLNGTQNGAGDITFNISGLTERHPHYLNQLLTLFQGMHFSQENLDNALNLYRKMTLEINNASLPARAAYYSNILLKVPPFIWNEQEKLDALQSITLRDIKHFHRQLMANIYIDLFAFGNYDSKMTMKMATASRALFGPTKVKQKLVRQTTFTPFAGNAWNEMISVWQDPVFLKSSYIYPEKSLTVSTQLKLLNSLFSVPFFNELRTKRQLAYDIKSYQEDIHQYPAFTLYIQSSNTGLQALKQHFDDFLERFKNDLALINEKTVTEAKSALLNTLQKKPQNIYIESNRYFTDWLNNNEMFDYNEQSIRALEATSKQDLITLYNRMFFDGYMANAIIQLRGAKLKHTEFFTWKDATKTSEKDKLSNIK